MYTREEENVRAACLLAPYRARTRVAQSRCLPRPPPAAWLRREESTVASFSEILNGLRSGIFR